MEGNCSEIQQTATNNTAHIDDKVLKIMVSIYIYKCYCYLVLILDENGL